MLCKRAQVNMKLIRQATREQIHQPAQRRLKGSTEIAPRQFHAQKNGQQLTFSHEEVWQHPGWISVEVTTVQTIVAQRRIESLAHERQVTIYRALADLKSSHENSNIWIAAAANRGIDRQWAL